MKGNCNMGDKCPQAHFDKKMAYAAKKAYKASLETPAAAIETAPKQKKQRKPKTPKPKGKQPGAHVALAISPPQNDLSPLDQ